MAGRYVISHLKMICLIVCLVLLAGPNTALAGTPETDVYWFILNKFQNINAILDAMEAALMYLSKHTSGINVDGLIGVRMLEGEFGCGRFGQFYILINYSLKSLLTSDLQ
ncbi:unnamed protein product [Protopolystoma xenopodis]|uniref:Receptor ligand binding region domain-containing protein n=1 Tax=Protopolystoma xenopodis TaxID=117903 RepID=A0A448XCG0_9PLAT|nr:unnamed protein product [Protopolystoma xenopodis]